MLILLCFGPPVLALVPVPPRCRRRHPIPHLSLLSSTSLPVLAPVPSRPCPSSSSQPSSRRPRLLVSCRRLSSSSSLRPLSSRPSAPLPKPPLNPARDPLATAPRLPATKQQLAKGKCFFNVKNRTRSCSGLTFPAARAHHGDPPTSLGRPPDPNRRRRAPRPGTAWQLTEVS